MTSVETQTEQSRLEEYLNRQIIKQTEELTVMRIKHSDTAKELRELRFENDWTKQQLKTLTSTMYLHNHPEE